jgi:nucleoside-diphosphate-sugar epimerase
MTILITGINGFIANYLYNVIKNKHTVIGTTREDSSKIIEILNKHKPEYIYHTGAEIYDNNKTHQQLSQKLPTLMKDLSHKNWPYVRPISNLFKEKSKTISSRFN